MTNTPDLGIPLLATQQQQPNVTHNDAIYRLSALSNGVISMGLNAAPDSPTVGDSYIVGSTPTGAWANRAHCIATYSDGGWLFIPGNDDDGTPIVMGTRQEGMNIYNQDDDTLYVWSGASWSPFSGGGGGSTSYGIIFFIGGKPSSGETVVMFPVAIEFSLPISLTDSAGRALTASTSNVAFSIQKNGTPVGTVVFNASATATFTFASAVTFNAGDIFSVVAPTPQDATLQDIGISLKGTKL